jgi:dipeptidyl aminopeptidase/acylaminoacyl peptidase
VSNTHKERPLVAVVLEGGRAVRVVDLMLSLPDLGAAPRDAGATFVRLSPNGRDFAVNIANTHVGLGRLALDADGVPTGAALIGQPVATDGWITMLRWSADGRHVLFADTAWNGGGLGAAINGPGRIGSIAFSADGAHRLVSQAQVSLSPEGFELSPDGDLIAVVNMERTYLPDALPYALFGRRDRSSLSLVAFDAATGALRVVDGPVGFDGVLPEDVMFDADGDMLAVAVFHERSAAPKAGRVDYWRIDRSTGAPRLVPTGRSTTVMRGAHDLALIK